MAGLTPEDSIFGNKAETNNKSSPPGDVGSSPLCPRCKSNKVWRDGQRETLIGEKIQRWSCRLCNYRFSDPDELQKARSAVEFLETKISKATADIVTTRQVCVTETKNLPAEHQTTEVLRRNEAEVKGKIIEHARSEKHTLT